MATPSASPSPAEQALAQLVPAALRERLRGRPLLVQRPVWGQRHGRHAARRAGPGLDFRDHRPYVHGDDPRQLDWRAVARRERLVLRQTESEDELSVTLVLDAGAGMDYGEGPQHKLTYARALVGGLAWLAQRQGDPVGVAIGRDQRADATLVRPRAGRDHLVAVAQHLLAATPLGRCPWIDLLGAVAPRLRRRSLLVLCSDLLDPGLGLDDADEVQTALVRGLSQLRARDHDVVILQVLHPHELSFPWDDRGMLRFEDLRGQRPPLEGPGSNLRQSYLARLRAHLTAQREACDENGVALLRFATDTPVEDAFAALLSRLAGQPTAGVEAQVEAGA